MITFENKTNENIVDPLVKNIAFKKFYEKLYGLEIHPNALETNYFLDKLNKLNNQ